MKCCYLAQPDKIGIKKGESLLNCDKVHYKIDEKVQNGYKCSKLLTTAFCAVQRTDFCHSCNLRGKKCFH